jgi:hypothetical protein
MSFLPRRSSPPFFILSLLLLLVAVAHTSLAAEKMEGLKTSLLSLPPDFFFPPETLVRENSPTHPALAGPVKDNSFFPGKDIYDASEFIKSFGIKPAKGALALYSKDAGVLFVKDSIANLKLINDLCQAGCNLEPTTLKNEIFLIELAPHALPPNSPTPTFAQLKKAAGKSWKQIAVLTLASKSGTRVRGTSTANIPPESSALATDGRTPAIGANDPGISCEIETVIGPDGSAVDSTLVFQYRNPQSNPPQFISYEGNSASRQGRLQLVQYVAGDGTGPAYAIVLKVTIVTAFRDTKVPKE